MTVSAPITTSLEFRSPDATTLLNAQVKDIFPRGVYGDTGLVTPAASGLAVTLAPYVLVGKDGMVHRTSASQDIAVTAGITQRLVFHSIYNQKAAATAVVEVIAESVWIALTSDQRLEYVTLAHVSPPSLATSVVSGDINYDARDAVDTLSRTPWRGTVATAADLPLPPTQVVRQGDTRLVMDTFLVWTYTGGNGWQIVDVDGLINLLDGRLKIPSQSLKHPWLEMGREGFVLPSSPALALYAPQMPVHPALSPVATFDADMASPALMALRAQRSSAANIAYVKGRSNGAGTVQAGDLRIGRVTTTGALVATVQIADPDVGLPIVSATFVVGTVDGLATYAYLKVGANPLIVEVTDLRLFLVQRNQARVGLTAGLAPVMGGDPDIGDTTAAFSCYSTSSGAELFYSSLSAVRTQVTAGETEFRLTEVANPSYAGKSAYEGRTDRGYFKGKRPDGLAETSWEVDAGLPGVGDVGAFLQLRTLGVLSGKLRNDALAALIAGASAIPNPSPAGLLTQAVLADTLHRHRDKGRGDGVISGLLPTSPGGLEVDISSGVAYIGGETWPLNAATFLVPDGPISYIYVDGVTDPTSPAVSLTTVKATALSTRGNVPLAAVHTTGAGSIATNGLWTIGIFVDNFDAKVVRSIGPGGHHPTLQDAVDWVRAYQEANVPMGVADFVLVGDQNISQPVSFAGVRGMRIRSIPGANYPATNGVGPKIVWTHDGPALDFSQDGIRHGGRDIVLEGIHFWFQGTVGTLGNSCAIAGLDPTDGGKNIIVRNCTTQSQAGSAFNKLRFFVHASIMEGWQVEGCEVDVTDFGVFAEAGLVRASISKNTIKQSGTAVNFSTIGIGSGDSGSDSLIDGNIIHPHGDNSGDGSGFTVGILSTLTDVRMTITSNTIRGGNPAVGAIGIQPLSPGCVVIGNTILQDLPFPTVSIGIAVYGGKNHRIIGNVVVQTDLVASQFAITVSGTGTNFALIADNYLEQASANCICLDVQGGCISAVIARNTINLTDAIPTQQIAVRTASLLTVVDNNQIGVGGRTGLAVQVLTAGIGCRVSANDITMASNPLANPIGVQSAAVGVRILGNVFSFLGASGASNGWCVQLLTASANNAVSNNVGTNTIWRGVQVDGTGHVVAGNDFATTDIPVDVVNAASQVSISDCHLRSTAGVAVVRFGASTQFCSVRGCEIDVGGDTVIPFDALGADWSIDDCDIVGSSTFTKGVVLAGSRGSYSNNRQSVNSSTSTAIELATGSSDMTVVGNTVKGSCGQIFECGIGVIHGLLLEGNQFDVTVGAAPMIAVGGTGANGIVVSGNTVRAVSGGGAGSSSLAAILAIADGTVDASVIDNSFTASAASVSDGGAAVYFGAGRGEVGDNFISYASQIVAVTIRLAGLAIGAGTGGVRAHHNEIVVTFTAPDAFHISDGIAVKGGAIDVSMDHNMLTPYQGFGISMILGTLGSGNIAACDNRIRIVAPASISGGTPSAGVMVQGTVQDIQICGNQITNIGAGFGISFGLPAGGSAINGAVVHGNIFGGVTLGAGQGSAMALWTQCTNFSITGNIGRGITNVSNGIFIDASALTGVCHSNVIAVDDATVGNAYTSVTPVNRVPT